LEELTRDLEAAWVFLPVAAFFAFSGRYGMGTTWLIVIVAMLGWLYFSAQLRMLRLRVPPSAVPSERRRVAPIRLSACRPRSSE